MRPEYREEPCRSALNRVSGMMFGWSLNPYMGCAHRCTFCYVRAFELRADGRVDVEGLLELPCEIVGEDLLRRNGDRLARARLVAILEREPLDIVADLGCDGGSHEPGVPLITMRAFASAN